MTESRIAAGIPAAMADGLAEVMAEMAETARLEGMVAGSSAGMGGTGGRARPARMEAGFPEVMGEMADRLPLGGMGAGSVEETAETENSCGTLAIPE